jgi:hypothetical protein
MPESTDAGKTALTSSENEGFTGSVSADRPTIYLDADGDLRLGLRAATEDGQIRDFVVCSRTLARTSPVWKAMLFGGFKESRPTEGEWIISLSNDDSEALLTLLNIIHGKFGMVPDTPRLEELYRILCVANKYDMTEAVRPWADNWVKLTEELQKEKAGGDPAMLTFVAWELGNQELFAKMVIKLRSECSIDADGRLTTPNGQCLEDYDHIGPIDLLGMPNHVAKPPLVNMPAEKIGESRRNMVQVVLNQFRDHFKMLLAGDYCRKRGAVEPRESILCDYAIFGSLCRAIFKTRGSMLLPESADDIAESLSDFYDSIVKIVVEIMVLSEHDSCNPAPKFRKKLADAFKSVGVIVTPSHENYMKKQRQKTGLHKPLPIRVKGNDGT